MKPNLGRVEADQARLPASLFAAAFGGLLGLALLKFGNPPIMEKWVSAPTNFYEFLLDSPWPIAWAYTLLALVLVLGLATARWTVTVPRWLLALPLAWCIWQCLSAAGSVSPEITRATLAHFFSCALCFYLGLFCLASQPKLSWFWPGLLCAFLLVLIVGWQQHFGGLEETRRYFYLYIYPKLKQVPPEYLKKISSPRIFSTLFYPNALAGVLLLLLPIILCLVWEARERFTQGARIFLLATLGVGALACLYWSGSKGGWLLMLLIGLAWLFRLRVKRQLKLGLVAGILVAGLVGFFWRYSAFFQKGATSVGARFDYWQAALQTISAHPLLGTGPGTFSIAYQQVKRPESEMARLAHNDYLQQGSDSGVLGLVLYSGFIVSALALGCPLSRLASKQGSSTAAPAGNASGPKRVEADSAHLEPKPAPSIAWPRFAIWLGVLAWALQSFVEFGLYIPALAWPAFAFLGFLVGDAADRPAPSIGCQSVTAKGLPLPSDGRGAEGRVQKSESHRQNAL